MSRIVIVILIYRRHKTIDLECLSFNRNILTISTAIKYS
jgi:hypothetical protein